MPLLNELAADWADPDLVPRPVLSIGAVFEGSGQRHEMDFHSHRKGELLLLMRGVLTCEVQGGLWFVPPQGAIWIPGGVSHKVTGAGEMEGYVVFIEPAVASNLPTVCCAVSTTPLLRELVIRCSTLPTLYAELGMGRRVTELLVDELAAAPTGNLHLPMPIDPRLRRIAEMMVDDPADRGTTQGWARRIGMSERSLARLLAKETGMSFGRWRHRLHMMLAVKWLGTGSPVREVAERLGYESSGSFVTMFRKAMGITPGRYIAQ
jgi:AraC-like DNA-binding protein